jgi:hypothetical protein
VYPRKGQVKAIGRVAEVIMEGVESKGAKWRWWSAVNECVMANIWLCNGASAVEV